jgi:hypothetical protein
VRRRESIQENGLLERAPSGKPGIQWSVKPWQGFENGMGVFINEHAAGPK